MLLVQVAVQQLLVTLHEKAAEAGSKTGALQVRPTWPSVPAVDAGTLRRTCVAAPAGSCCSASCQAEVDAISWHARHHQPRACLSRPV